MKNKTIQTDFLPFFIAGAAISNFELQNKKASTHHLILAELINLSDHETSTVYQTDKATTEICKKLEITPDVFRQAIAKLKKMGLITREENNFVLPVICRNTSLIIIKSK